LNNKFSHTIIFRIAIIAFNTLANYLNKYLKSTNNLLNLDYLYLCFMFTENEIAAILEDPEILEAVQHLKNNFRKKEAPFLEISDHDFFCLTLMMPSISIALASGSISLMEEMALNKKARKVSKGGYFLKKDPVVYAMKFLIGNAGVWENKFYKIIVIAMKKTIDFEKIVDGQTEASKISESEFKKLLMNAPYIFIRFIHSFFWDETHEDLSERRRISKVELEKIKDIGNQLELSKTLVFRKFLDTFDVK